MLSVDEVLRMIPELLDRLAGIERQQEEILRMVAVKSDRMVPHVEACEMLGVSLRTLIKLNNDQGFGGKKMGRGWFFPLSRLVCASLRPQVPVGVADLEPVCEGVLRKRRRTKFESVPVAKVKRRVGRPISIPV